MAQGPVVQKRVMVGGPPSDLPDKPLEYPGKPLSRRYNPLDQTRKFEEAKPDSPNKVAVSTPFKPVSSIPFPDKNVHIAPVSNMQPRGLQPVGLRGSLLLPVGGAGLYDLSDEIRGPLEARLDRVTNVPRKPLPEISPQSEKQLFPKKPSAPTQAAVAPETLHTELENLKTLARKELAQREGAVVQHVPPSSVAATISTTQVPQTTMPPQTEDVRTPILETQVQAVEPVTPKKVEPLPPIQPPQRELEVAQPVAAPVVPSQPAPKPEEETQRLLGEAQKLESQLSQLREGITTNIMEAESSKEAGKELAQRYDAQIGKLTLENNNLQKRFAELSNSYNEEVQKKHNIERQLETQTKDFGTQLQHIQIEKTNLLGQIKNLEEKSGEFAESQAQEKRQIQEITLLKSQVARAEKERDEANARLQKLEGWVKELGIREREERGKPAKAVKPKEVKGEKEAVAAPKIVKPQVAVGKMAPALTSAPNVINGIVKDQGGLLLSNVIIVVKDASGQPARALKTNKIGQFAISTPLPNGTYTMELESESHSFDVVEVAVEGKVMPPIEIKAAG
jgi:hypothetical protein